jgi:hypothetical protein
VKAFTSSVVIEHPAVGSRLLGRPEAIALGRVGCDAFPKGLLSSVLRKPLEATDHGIRFKPYGRSPESPQVTAMSGPSGG